MSDFPNKVWDGLTKTHKRIGTRSRPSPYDLLEIIDEIQATQKVVLTLGVNSSIAFVETVEERNAIASRTEGMLAYVSLPQITYQLLPAPWDGSDSDWIVFSALHPYLAPKFLSLTLQGISTTQEAGESISGPVTFLWTVENASNILPNSLTITDVTTSQVLASNLPNTGSYTLTLSPVTHPSGSVHAWKISGSNTKGQSFSKNLIVTWAAVSGQTYYIDPTGDDADSGSTDEPWATLQRAYSVAVGDTVIVRAGTYTAGLNLYGHSGGTPAHPIRFLAESGVILTHSATSGINAALAGINIENSSGWFEVDGFEINSDGSIQRAGIRTAVTANIKITNCIVNGAFIGFFFSNSENVTLEDSIGKNSTDQHGVYAAAGLTNCIIRRCEFFGNNWDGVHINALNGNFNTNTLVEDCIIHDNALSGMDVEGAFDARLQNNLIYGNGKHGIVFHSLDQPNTPECRDCIVANNTIVSSNNFCIYFASGNDKQILFNNVLYQTVGAIYGSIGLAALPTELLSDYNTVINKFSSDSGVSSIDFATWKSSTSQDAHSILMPAPDAAFTNFASANFHLIAGTTLLNAGTPGFSRYPAPLKDYDGLDRPQGTTYDIGAFERTAGTSTPSAPTTLTAVDSDPYQINLSWTLVGANESSIVVERSTTGSFSVIASLSGRETSYIDSGLTTGTTYNYRIKAVNWVGSSAYSNTASEVGPPAPVTPASPTGLTATPASFNTIDLAWTDVATVETAYHVERSSNNIDWLEVKTLPAGTVSYSDKYLSPTQKYYYRIQAENATVFSGYSNVSSTITPPITPGDYTAFSLSDAPTLVAGPDFSGGINTGMKFKALVDGLVSGLRFYKHSTNTGTHIMRLWDGETPIAEATFSGESASGWQEEEISPAVPLSANTVYFLSLHSFSGKYSYTASYFTATFQRGPLELFQDNGYYLYSELGNAWLPTTKSPSNTNYWTDLIFTVPNSSPIGPSSLTVTILSGSSVRLKWNDNSRNEDSFKVERSTNGVDFSTIATPSYGVPEYDDTGLTAGTYHYRIRATNTVGDSGSTNTVIVNL